MVLAGPIGNLEPLTFEHCLKHWQWFACSVPLKGYILGPVENSPLADFALLSLAFCFFFVVSGCIHRRQTELYMTRCPYDHDTLAAVRSEVTKADRDALAGASRSSGAACRTGLSPVASTPATPSSASRREVGRGWRRAKESPRRNRFLRGGFPVPFPNTQNAPSTLFLRDGLDAT